MNTPIDNETIQNKVGNCKFVPYCDMHLVKRIEDLLPRTLILYQLSDIGHFVCIFGNKEGINFFDPLGFCPDDELKFADKSIVNERNLNYAYLLKLLSETNMPVNYNQFKLQKMSTATCGSWCGIRMMCQDMTTNEFAHCFDKVKNKDQAIVDIFKTL
jgi:hypothetical protein